ncbi:MAG: hypothetical protein NO515_07855 [Candidatus Methanomethylicia archaeon]|jgi:predicted transcriptional regulator|nr:hypothetical protein [Candidatus Methanomethylicia archaeon]
MHELVYEESRDKKEEDELEMMLRTFLSPAPVNILRELSKKGKVVKSEFLEKGKTGVYWPTYSRYEEALLKAGLIKIEKEDTFPFRQTIELTEKGKRVVELLNEIERLIMTEENH